MITLNLLPDIKKEYLRSQRIKRLFVAGAALVSGGFIALVVLLGLFVFGAQKLHLSRVQSDIDEAANTLQSQPDLDKVVTIQKQLDSLPGLHEQKPAADRLLGYLNTVVPKDISLTGVEITLYDGEDVTISGLGNDPKAVNIFVDTLKNATFTYIDDSGTEQSIEPFSRVVLDSISVDNTEGTTYRINLEYDELIFDNTIKDWELKVPKITTSASVQERPALFESPGEEEE